MRALGAMCVVLALAACPGGRSSTLEESWEREASIHWAPVLAACGTPTVDGVLSPGEWDGAVADAFTLRLDVSEDPEAVVQAEIMARSDDENLYVALRMGADASAYENDLRVTLHANGSDDGDDRLRYSWPAGSQPQALFEDEFLWDCLEDTGALIVQRRCANPDSEGWMADLLNGTRDGGGAIHFGDGETTIELWHPYTGRDPRDIARTAGQLIHASFELDVARDCTPGAPGSCIARNYFSTQFFPEGCTAPAADPHVVAIRVGTSGEPLPTIDDSMPTFTVTILGSGAFDVREVDPSTLFFTRAPVMRDRSGAPRASVEDVNGDGIDDLIAHFRPIDLASFYWDTALAGRTRAGLRFHGSIPVRVLRDER